MANHKQFQPIRLLDLTLPSPEENLALDEALLDRCDGDPQTEVIRFWESSCFFVVVGYANAVEMEVNLDYCRNRGIPILRRCTGGGTVLQGPGVLNYSLVLRVDRAPALQSVHGTNNYILDRHARAFATILDRPVTKEGHTDLAANGLKFSGNAQRRRKNALLFHGSFLLSLDLDLVEHALRFPSKQPDYRRNRSHGDFLVNLHLSPVLVKAHLNEAWAASEKLPPPPLSVISALVRDKYSRPEWNAKF